MSFKIAATAVCTTCRKESPGAFVVVEPQGYPMSEHGDAPESVAPEFSFALPPDWAQAFSCKFVYCEVCKNDHSSKYFIQFHPIW